MFNFKCIFLFLKIISYLLTLIILFSLIIIIIIIALRFTVEPYNVVVAEGSSVLLPCKGEIVDTKLPIKGKNHKNSLDSLPDIRWRGPDGQDIGIVGDTFR